MDKSEVREAVKRDLKRNEIATLASLANYGPIRSIIAIDAEIDLLTEDEVETLVSARDILYDIEFRLCQESGQIRDTLFGSE